MFLSGARICTCKVLYILRCNDTQCDRCVATFAEFWTMKSPQGARCHQQCHPPTPNQHQGRPWKKTHANLTADGMSYIIQWFIYIVGGENYHPSGKKNMNWSIKLDRFLKFRRKKHKSLLKPQRPRYSWHVHGPWSRQSWKSPKKWQGWTTNIRGKCILEGTGDDGEDYQKRLTLWLLQRSLAVFGWRCMAFAVSAATNYVEWRATL